MSWEALLPTNSQLPAELDRLLSEFYLVLIDQTPVMVKKLDKAGASKQGRRAVAAWLVTLLKGRAEPEIKLRFLAALWPLAGDLFRPPLVESDLQQINSGLEQLMTDLGDRARVQKALIIPAAPPEGAPAAPRLPQAAEGPPWGLAPSPEEPMFKGLTPVKAPRYCVVPLPSDHSFNPGSVRPPFSGARARGHISALDAFGDKLLIQYQLRAPVFLPDVHRANRADRSAQSVCYLSRAGRAPALPNRANGRIPSTCFPRQRWSSP